ncbi:MAG: rhomboid family intramembrane serine protease [Crocinitomicaceae bacterium]
MKITFNSPFILWFAFLSLALLGVQYVVGGTLAITVLDGTFHQDRWQDYVSLFTYIFGHKDFAHYIGNFSIILLIGPSLEKELGTKTLTIYTLITTLVTAIIHIAFWDAGLLGASGIVFMMIVLTSLIGRKNNEIPLTFILVFVLFVGQEFLKATQPDQISQFAHICGGVMGLILGVSRR